LKSLHSTAQRCRRILVADDNVDAAESMAALIGLHGHEVQIAHSGREALDVAARFQPDLAFLDLKMPDLDGFETARQLRATREGQRTVLVALTGWGQAGDRQRTSAAGFDAHLVKPIDENTLLRTLELAERGP
jgi:CheY-like chemotaxis protein